MAKLTQENRLMAISDFGLGKDAFLITSFSGSEYLCGLFEYEVEVLSDIHDLTPEKVVGKAGTVTIQNDQKRKFNGYVRRLSMGEAQGHDYRQYRLVLVPWLWFLGKTQSNRIFQNKTTKDIISKVFADLGFTEFEFRGCATAPHEYCVQYGESDLNFVLRLLQEEGFVYYFKHSDGKHRLIITDSFHAAEPLPETDLEYSPGSNPNAQIVSWDRAYQFRKGAWTLNDYAFKTPKKNLKVNTKTLSNFVDNKKFEHYEYADIGLHEQGASAARAKMRLESEEASRDLAHVTSNCSSFFAAGTFKVAKHSHASERGEYTIVQIHHNIIEHSYFQEGGGNSNYQNHFVCMPADKPFRPPLTLAKPVMRGPQSAIVVGPKGEEIYVDKFGRIKVQFIWDREGSSDENSTCFIRVMQIWAGNTWGASFIPRIGHEVIISFLDGDPDRPIVAGSVYNGDNLPPYTSKTQSGIKTRSTKGGTGQNFNELRFDDKIGNEQVYMHAEKDFDSVVEHNQTRQVGHDRSLTVGNNEATSIGNNRTESVGNNETIAIGNNRDKSVGKNQTETIGANKTISVGGNHTESIDGKVVIDVGGTHTESIQGNVTITMAANLKESVEGTYTEAVTKDYSLKAKTITLKADDSITLQTGSAKITMSKNGDITISGKNVTVKGSGDVVLKGSKISAN
jgi:type VI secretion system secreted protein VgrG